MQQKCLLKKEREREHLQVSYITLATKPLKKKHSISALIKYIEKNNLLFSCSSDAFFFQAGVLQHVHESFPGGIFVNSS